MGSSEAKEHGTMRVFNMDQTDSIVEGVVNRSGKEQGSLHLKGMNLSTTQAVEGPANL